MRGVIELRKKHELKWWEKDDMWWFARLAQELGELGDSLTGEAPSTEKHHELRQIASICLNWLDKDGVYSHAMEEEADELR